MGHDLNGKTKTINLLEEKQCNLRVGRFNHKRKKIIDMTPTKLKISAHQNH